MYRLGLLACDFVPEHLRDRFEDYPSMFATAIASAEVEVEWEVYQVYNGQLPESIDECDIFKGGHTVDAGTNPFYEDFTTGAFSHDQRSVAGTPHFNGHGSDLTSTFTPMTSKPMWIKIDLVEQDYNFQD